MWQTRKNAVDIFIALKGIIRRQQNFVANTGGFSFVGSCGNGAASDGLSMIRGSASPLPGKGPIVGRQSPPREPPDPGWTFGDPGSKLYPSGRGPVLTEQISEDPMSQSRIVLVNPL